MRRRGGAQSGFTLVEMMLGIAVMAGLTLAMTATFAIGFRTISQESRKIAADTTLSNASLPLTRDLSASGLAGTWFGGGAANPLTPGTGFFVVVYGPGNQTVVTYAIDAAGNLTRTVNFGTATVSARGLSSLTATNSGCQWTITLLPSAVGATARSFTVSQRYQGCF